MLIAHTAEQCGDITGWQIPVFVLALFTGLGIMFGIFFWAGSKF